MFSSSNNIRTPLRLMGKNNRYILPHFLRGEKQNGEEEKESKKGGDGRNTDFLLKSSEIFYGEGLHSAEKPHIIAHRKFVSGRGAIPHWR